MSVYGKTDSEVTSLTASSPTRVYYVQSPSRDSSSHDGEKTTNSFNSSPVLSPMGSPGSGHHSRDTSTRYSRSNKVSRSRKGDKNFDAIEEEEEGFLEQDVEKSFPRYCYFPAFVFGFFLLFSLFSIILWAASTPQKPIITMKSIAFDKLVVQAGADASGVATDMITLNSTVKLIFRNTGTFFGVHVTSSPLDLSHFQLTLATGNIQKFYQSRKSQRSVTVMLKGSHVPLYGGSADLSTKDGKLTAPISFTLNLVVRAQAYVLGKLVKPKFEKRVRCWVVLDPNKMNKAILLNKLCDYQ